MRGILTDLRHAARSLRRRPGLVAVVTLTLALGVGANASVFAILERVVLRPLPYAEPDRLVSVRSTSESAERDFSGLTIADYRDFGERSRSFAGVAATYRPFAERRAVVEEAGRSTTVASRSATPGFFRTLGVSPRLGRTFLPGDAGDGAAPVVVLDHGAWERRFGADPGALGRSVRIDGRPHEVVGVLPEDFEFELGTERPELWLPLAWPPAAAEDRDAHLLEVVARLRSGVTMATARADAERVGRLLAEAHPATNAATGFELVPLHRAIVGDVTPALRALGLAAALVLLVACVNVAVLLLARGDVRRGEMALRMALGAAPARVARLVFAESLLLALAGGLGGLALGVVTARGLVALSPVRIPRLDGVGPDLPLVGFTLAACLVAGLLAGLLPALQGRGRRSGALLGTRGVLGRPGRGADPERLLVGLEAALVIVLLSGAFTAGGSLLELLRVDPGFDPRDRVALSLDLPGVPAAEAAADPDRFPRFVGRVVERVEAVPGVRGAGAVSNLPLNPAGWSGSLFIRGREVAPSGRRPVTDWELASPGYFEAAGIPRVRGRTFRTGDGPGAPLVAVVNETMARRFWPDGDPIGAMINGNAPEGPWRRVVGVVGDVKQQALGAETRAHMYVPLAQAYPLRSVALVVWTGAGGRSAALPGVRAALRELDPGLAVGAARPLADLVGDSARRSRFYATLLGLFAAIALLLGLVGIYGIVSHWVAGRTREIGLRVALGAARWTVVAGVMRRGLVPTAAGCVLGLGLALVAARLSADLFYGVRAADPARLATVALLLMGGATLASFLPARHAARLDPAEVLKA